ncbi:GFA family protein, partial [Enterococcus faecium]|uniref:GFA family protein n=1 Tax=Enterococcus faecium TaxID=1352 RepID=UPI003F51AF8A
MSISGGCLCGAVKIAISGDPLDVVQCWWRQCQRRASGGPTQNAIFKSCDVSITG